MQSFHAFQALLPRGWARNVRLDVDAQGTLAAVTPDQDPADAQPLAGPVLPGMPNLHSHAFQRGLAGRTERPAPTGEAGADTFWSWRSEMYRFVQGAGPEQLVDLAAALYVELLEGGYTSVAEFHYLHRDPHGRPYDDPALLARLHLDAARRTGIGFTVLPVLYAHGDFGGAEPDPGQRRFVLDPDSLVDIYEALASDAGSDPNVRVGVGLHSLRAVTPRELDRVVTAVRKRDAGAPVHIHAAEQVREVEACLAWSGARPVEWLLDNAPVTEEWCLVHATHMTPEETGALARSGAVAGLCPTTEANLGDGVFPLADFQDAGGTWGVGSDSHVSVRAVDELRLLEYGQRLTARERNVASRGSERSTGAALFGRALAGGSRASGRPLGALESGARADWVVLDPGHPGVVSSDGDGILDAWIFRGGRSPVRDVFVGGVAVVREGRHPLREETEAQALAAVRAVVEG